MIPLLTLGIPANVVMAVLLGAFLVHGIQPGPLLVKEHPEIFWGVIASMYIGNVMLLVLNLRIAVIACGFVAQGAIRRACIPCRRACWMFGVYTRLGQRVGHR